MEQTEYRRPDWFKPNVKYAAFERLNECIEASDDGGPDTEFMARSMNGTKIEILGETLDDERGVIIEVLAEFDCAKDFAHRRMVLISGVCLNGFHPVCDISDQADCQCICHNSKALNNKAKPEHEGSCSTAHVGLSHTGWAQAIQWLDDKS